MTMYLYQPINVTTRGPADINANPEALTAYQRLTCLFGGETDFGSRIRAALEFGFFRHTYTVEGYDPEDAFQTAEYRGMGWPTPKLIWNADKTMSGAVGNIVIDDENRGWVCLAEGWQELADDIVRLFQAKVTTVITQRLPA